MPSISKQPIIGHTKFGDFGSISNEAPSGLQEVSGYERFNWTERFSNIREYCYYKFKARNPLLRECLAEFFGTFLFLSFGLASVAQFVFSGKTSFISVNIAFGFALTISIIVVGKVSGAHLNPAVSFSQLLLGRMPGYKFVFFVVAQCLGAWLASLMVFLVYLNQLQRYKGGMFSMDTAGIFATYPNDITDPTSTFSMFFDQFFSTALFIIAILAITDKLNTELHHEVIAVLIGLSLMVIGASFGFNCGFAVNPARDFAPRIFTAMAGWGSKTFSAANGFFWIPVFAPMFGSFFGTVLYSLFISNHWFPDDI